MALKGQLNKKNLLVIIDYHFQFIDYNMGEPWEKPLIVFSLNGLYFTYMLNLAAI